MKKFELLAPGGDLDAIRGAIAAGANAVYCGLDKFNARNRASNISFDDLYGILRLAHANHCQVFLTLNILIVESEIPDLIHVLNKLVNTGIDGVILQDLGLIYLISTYFSRLNIHASTQLNTHNVGQLQFLSKLSVDRVNLSRELSIGEIKELVPIAHANNCQVEVFVHGSNCICFSGLCYMSSFQSGNSGNRGRCSQPCRDQYLKTLKGENFPLNIKDNSAWYHLQELYDVGVDSLKIEGRIKKVHYVYSIVEAWRAHLHRFYNLNPEGQTHHILYNVFNRDFSDGYIKGIISEEMFINNPRDHSAIRRAESYGGCSEANLEKAKGVIAEEREALISRVDRLIEPYRIEKGSLKITLEGECGTPLKVTVNTRDTEFVFHSDIPLMIGASDVLNAEVVMKRFKSLNEIGYVIENLDLMALQAGVFLPFKALTALKNRMLFTLNNFRVMVESVTLPKLPNPAPAGIRPTLAVIISSKNDLCLTDHSLVTFYFQLSNAIKTNMADYIELFSNYVHLIPWFPAVLIDEDYFAAVQLIEQLHPAQIVTDNSGIAFEAYRLGIRWIAGPSMNMTNSWSLKCLKELYDCSGTFVSNELSKSQLQRIKKPSDFELCAMIYRPIVLMTSRQCLFHQIDWCKKEVVDRDCILFCEKHSSITNIKNEKFVIAKSANNYHRIFSTLKMLNTDIVADLPDLFSRFVIDLSDIQTDTDMSVNKALVIQLFVDLMEGVMGASDHLHRVIRPTINIQYQKGI